MFPPERKGDGEGWREVGREREGEVGVAPRAIEAPSRPTQGSPIANEAMPTNIGAKYHAGS